ncbi:MULTISPECIES: S8 family serine peptidase [unclassified Rathayibacter]|uniref:S8 family serine peptidase n=1 Tax=unclassified Rathayibacter TaxID=2609250 RepID=UPI00188C7B1D|nr:MULTISPECIES: S8 family serine peptidase [unclassified Rathayibacter]MBF4461678.1 S8 family serine peptidase [Rathayibacter sp. VKM Ac-2879]MBF4503089.1 S8 family serine peptidase [Rathayibacter sp. VKM Ac-2878]
MPIHSFHRPPVRRAERRILAGLAALGVAATAAFAATAASAAPLAGSASIVGGLSTMQSFDDGDYVVTLVEPSAATYQGTDARFARTAPEAGSQLQAGSAPVEDYSAHLEQRQDAVASAADVTIGYHYTVALNGFSASLTGAQASELAGRKDVARVRPVEDLTVDRAAEASAARSASLAAAALPVPDTGQESSTSFLGLDGADGVWSKVGGIDKAGQGIVVGSIDSGIAPENPSFAGPALATSPGAAPYTDGTTVTYRKSDGTSFVGSCSPGLAASEQWNGSECNQKLIGARWFLGANEGAGSSDNPEYLSPRDADGHGSHTASTAAGNAGVDATVDGYDYGDISGVAPAAKVAAYKVCWNGTENGTDDDDFCSGTGILAAIDAAVADGVDVINFSIGGGAATSTLTPIDEAFLNAAAAGVFVAASAGNSGPGASTLDHASPWYTTVAASSIPTYTATATLGNGDAFAGGSITVHSPVTGPLVNSADVVLPGTESPTICAPGSLDPSKVAGTIVACTAGTTARVSKSAEVKRAGGIGMLLLNPFPNALHVDDHSVPSIQIDSQAYDSITTYASTPGATVTLTEGNSTGTTIPVPQVAGFSSRGPAEADGSDVLKPDITAPGVAILADSFNAEGDDPAFAFESGTSMSSPHIAGLAALILGVTPQASPSAVKSAMMTSAYDTVDQSGVASEDVFAQGAGHVDPTAFLDPGLLYESGTSDWIAFLKGEGYVFTPNPAIDPIEAIDPSDLNQASIAIGALAGSQTVTRTVTSTGPGSYTPSIDVPGIDAVVSPSTLSFTAAGQAAQYTVSFTTGSAELNEFATGYLTWSSAEHEVRSPVAVRPVLLDAPYEVSGTGSTGSATATITPGVDGPLPLTTSGLVEGVLAEDATAADGHSGTLPAGDTFETTVVVPEGSTFARFDLDSTDDTADLDLYVDLLDASGAPVSEASSATASADERVDLADPAPGTYRVTADIYAVGASSTVTFDLRSFVIPAEGGVGSLATDPTTVDAVQGEPTDYAVSWSNLAGPAQYLGRVAYADSGRATLVSVDVPESVTPTPTPTATPEPTGTPEPTATPTAGPAPTDSPSASPTAGPIVGPGTPGSGSGGLASTGWNGGLLGAGALALLGAGAVITGLRRRAQAQREGGAAE